MRDLWYPSAGRAAFRNCRDVRKDDIYPYGVCNTYGRDKVPPGSGQDGVKANNEKILNRLARLEGQVRGVAGMVEADRYCMDILAQTAAIRSALLGVEKLILENHAGHCVQSAIESGDPVQQRAKFDELIALLQKASR